MADLEELNREFRSHIEEIMYASVRLKDPYERVTTLQWIRKLHDMDDRVLPVATLRNHYSKYLKITMDNDVIHMCAPFKEPPPKGNLRPLCEVLANYIAAKCPPIPMTGPIEPVMSQSSEDGKVYTTVRQSPDGGIYCYLAVTPDTFENPDIL